MLAASKGHTKVVKQLLEAGANTDLQTTDSEVYTVYTVPKLGGSKIIGVLISL